MGISKINKQECGLARKGTWKCSIWSTTTFCKKWLLLWFVYILETGLSYQLHRLCAKFGKK